MRFCRAPPTPPVPSALLPRPLPGAGSVRGDIRGAAVSGSSPGSPHAVDRGDIAFGVGLTGRGNSFPLPCLPHSNHLTSRRHPARAFAEGYPYASAGPHPARACGRDTYTRLPASPTPPAPPAGRLPTRFCRGTPTPPAPAALLPRPQRGAGSVRGDIR